MDTNDRFIDIAKREEIGGSADGQIEPVCKFGPGGDYVSFWPSKPGRYGQSGLTRLLNKLAQLIAAPPSSLTRDTLVRATSPPVPGRASHQPTDRHIVRQKEELENAVTRRDCLKPTDPTSTPTITSNSLFSGQPVLFPNHSGARPGAVHKPKHRIRAYRRAAKKAPALRLPRQGSLFEAHFSSARTA
jgi:hypothetical protein